MHLPPPLHHQNPSKRVFRERIDSQRGDFQRGTSSQNVDVLLGSAKQNEERGREREREGETGRDRERQGETGREKVWVRGRERGRRTRRNL